MTQRRKRHSVPVAAVPVKVCAFVGILAVVVTGHPRTHARLLHSARAGCLSFLFLFDFALVCLRCAEAVSSLPESHPQHSPALLLLSSPCSYLAFAFIYFGSTLVVSPPRLLCTYTCVRIYLFLCGGCADTCALRLHFCLGAFLCVCVCALSSSCVSLIVS